MKTTINSLAILLAAGLPAVAVAEALGARLPHSFNVENAVGAFALAFVALIALSDYSRRSRRLVNLTAVPAVAANRSACEPHRLAA